MKESIYDFKNLMEEPKENKFGSALNKSQKPAASPQILQENDSTELNSEEKLFI